MRTNFLLIWALVIPILTLGGIVDMTEKQILLPWIAMLIGLGLDGLPQKN